MNWFKNLFKEKNECGIRTMDGDRYNELYNQTTTFKPIDMGFQCFQVNAPCFDVDGKLYQCEDHQLRFMRYYPSNQYRIKELKRVPTEDNKFEYDNLYIQIKKELDEKFAYVYTITERLDGDFFIYIVKGVLKNDIKSEEILNEKILKVHETIREREKELESKKHIFDVFKEYHRFKAKQKAERIIDYVNKYELSFDPDKHFELEKDGLIPTNYISRDENDNYIFTGYIDISGLWFTLKGEIK